MKNETLITAFLLSIAAFSVQSAETIQHKLARVVMDAENASYVVVEHQTGVSVVTYAYKDASATCKFLISKGVNVISVENYNTSDENDMITITSKIC